MTAHELRETQGFYYPPEELASKARIPDWQAYQQIYLESISQPDKFWAEQAENFFWQKKWQRTLHQDAGLTSGWRTNHWFQGGLTNLCYNCLDRHLPAKSQQPALIWEADQPGQSLTFTYQELYQQVEQMAQALTHLGIKTGDRVSIYLPMIPELVVTMLACARLGAVHHVIYAGFSARSLMERLLDVSPKLFITADGTWRAGKAVPIKSIADQALREAVQRGLNRPISLVMRRLGAGTGVNCPLDPETEYWRHEVMPAGPPAPPVWLESASPLFILHTPGSSGRPRGIVHGLGGYMVQVGLSHKLAFAGQPVHWCLNDLGWISGHSYLLYGPLLNGQTTLLYEGTPTFPAPDRLWRMVDTWQVNSFYASPAILRRLMNSGKQAIPAQPLESLKVLGSVGEPLTPELWHWYRQEIGHNQCPVLDTWCQTQNGGINITTLPASIPAYPGLTGLPFLGIEALLLDKQGKHIEQTDITGYLAIKPGSPGFMIAQLNQDGQPQNLEFPPDSFYLTGDLARREKHGYYQVLGRDLDYLQVQGCLFSPREVEEILLTHPAVAKAAVTGYPHRQKGEGVCAFVVTWAGHKTGEALKMDLQQLVAHKLTPQAAPEIIVWVKALPQTHSGHVLRRILKALAAQQTELLMEVASLSDPQVLNNLLREL